MNNPKTISLRSGSDLQSDLQPLDVVAGCRGSRSSQIRTILKETGTNPKTRQLRIKSPQPSLRHPAKEAAS